MGKKILVVDDQMSVQSTLRLLLESEGYEVSVCGGIKEAIEKSDGIDLVLVDFYLEEKKTGLDLCKFLIEKNPGIKIILLTIAGFGDEGRKEASALGITGYLKKPFKNNDLLDLISHSLS